MSFSRPIIILLGIIALAGVVGTGIFLTRHHQVKGPQMTEPTENRDFAKRAELLTPEQMAMWRREHRSEMRGMSKGEKKTFRKNFHQQLEAMSTADRDALAKQLQAQFDALPAGEKQKIQEKLAKRGGGKKRGGAAEEDDEE